MENSTSTPNYSHQLKTVFEYLQNRTATASMIAEATGIPQKNICRYKRELEQAGKLSQVMKYTCKVTGFRAWYLSTNVELLTPDVQLNLF
jgi:DNA-binding IclR family transcriptional regulator